MQRKIPLMASNPLQTLVNDLNKDVETRVHKLRSGNLPDIAEYKYVCGQIRGLESAIEQINSLLQTMEYPDE